MCNRLLHDCRLGRSLLVEETRLLIAQAYERLCEVESGFNGA